jgi:hypothetical protein
MRGGGAAFRRLRSVVVPSVSSFVVSGFGIVVCSSPSAAVGVGSSSKAIGFELLLLLLELLELELLDAAVELAIGSWKYSSDHTNGPKFDICNSSAVNAAPSPTPDDEDKVEPLANTRDTLSNNLAVHISTNAEGRQSSSSISFLSSSGCFFLLSF